MDARLTEWLWGADNDPPLNACRKSGSCLVVGPARGVWDDLRKVDAGSFDYRIGVNRAGLCCPHVEFDRIATLHHEKAAFMRECYTDWTRGTVANIPLDSNDADEGVDVVWKFAAKRGTSGLFGVKVALAMGFDRIVIAGIPFDAFGYEYWPDEMVLPNWVKYGTNDRDRMYWEQCADVSNGKVTSLSGWTAKIFSKE